MRKKPRQKTTLRKKPSAKQPSATRKLGKTAMRRPGSDKPARAAAHPGNGASPGPSKPDLPHEGGAFPIVGIGASAGGLEAFTQVLQHLPTDTGMAYVLVQHLHPEYASALTEILSRVTTMPVSEVVDGMRVEPDHVYVIPPNAYLGILHGALHLMPRGDIPGQNLPIDYFFRSLADDLGSKAIGVILSGTASDGVLGLKAIKGDGGVTFAQDEKSAKYDGMPHSAIAAGCVDFILPPDKIALELARIARHPYVHPLPETALEEGLPKAKDHLDKIFLLLRRHSGNDFTYYKRSTIHRRIKRRMLLHKLEKLADYWRYLQEYPAEVRDLFHDILINVTSFFRDPESFAVLTQKVFPAIMQRPADAPVRIWVPGCSTGEETYSLAITLLEHLGDMASGTPIQIFATDIDDLAIEKARAGIYPENIAQDVSPERLRRFFVKTEGGYQISKSIRDMCVFAVQNVSADPPFSRLDLISCRNLLIYLMPVLQKKVLTMFHYALKPTGFLLLGTAESIGEHADLFRTVDPKVKLYAKKSVAMPVPVGFGLPAAHAMPALPATVETEATASAPDRFDVRKEADRLLLAKYAPAGVVINEHMDILQFRGRTGPYLEPAPGEASLNLLKMSREGLMLELNAVVKRAIKENHTVRKDGVSIKLDGEIKTVNLEVAPIRGPGERCFLVLIEDVVRPGAGARQKPVRAEKSADKRVHRLEQELAATKEYLQSIIEQQETSNEELRSASEEIQSSNEELQSINEELETAKEELQSTNEELATVNDELASRNLDLNRVNNDLSNLIGSVNIPIVIVGPDLSIRRFTPAAEKLMNLIATDIGRAITDIKPNFDSPSLGQLIAEVSDTISGRQAEIRDKDGHWYSLRIQPYKTLDNRIDGAVLVFIDIDEIKRGLELARDARDYAESIVTALKHPILVLDKDLRVVSTSTAYLQHFQVNAKETVGNLLYRLGNGQWGIPQLRAKLEDAVNQGSVFDAFPVTHEFEKIGRKTVAVSGWPIAAGTKTGPMVLMQIEDSMERSGQIPGQ